MSIENRLRQVQERVAKACARAGRAPESVRILAVSKAQLPEKVRQAAMRGQKYFGENYVQEAVDKVAQLEGLGLQWHFIGRIQSNKIKQLAGRFAVIHSVDRLSVAEGIQQVSNAPQEIFLQYNVADEASKGGAGAAEIERLAAQVRALPNLNLTGLMVMPPLFPNPEQVRPFFKKARDLAAKLGLNELSMGTSADFEVAVEEGATWIRTGTDIFGPRDGSPGVV